MNFARFTLAILALAAWPSTAHAQCQEPNGNDTASDYEALQCLLDQGGTIVVNADVQYGYFTDRGLVLRRSGTTLQGSSAYGYRALLQATPDLTEPILQIESGSVSNYTISQMWFYGDRFDRVNPNCTGDQSSNLFLRGSGFLVDNIESATAPCNTSTVVEGGASNFEIRNSWFANNGWSETEIGDTCPGTRCWADGLTLHSCIGGYVHDNQFRDNTDVDLVVGGGSNCRIEYNNVEHILSYGFAGFHVGWFPGAGDGYHAGNTYRFNTVSSGQDKLAFGIVLGLHPWNWRQGSQVSHAGSTTDSSSTGAVVNLAVDGIASGTFERNSGNGARGTNAYGNCTRSADYTAADYGGAIVQGGWIYRVYHDGSCSQ